MNKSKASILLVEDEENLLDALKLNLELEGYEVTTATTGPAALKKVEEEYFDLILLDVMLPELDGFDVCQTIRLKNVETPILMLSARSGSADRVAGLKRGADDYLTKPFNLEELLLRVEKLIEKKERADKIKEQQQRISDLCRTVRHTSLVMTGRSSPAKLTPAATKEVKKA